MSIYDLMCIYVLSMYVTIHVATTLFPARKNSLKRDGNVVSSKRRFRIRAIHQMSC